MARPLEEVRWRGPDSPGPRHPRATITPTGAVAEIACGGRKKSDVAVGRAKGPVQQEERGKAESAEEKPLLSPWSKGVPGRHLAGSEEAREAR